MGKKTPMPVISRIRFPRLQKDRDFLYLAMMRAKYPPPPYNPVRDGSWNPADGVFNALLGYSKKKLRRLCKKHALDFEGPRRKLIKRMYLHWRAKKLGLGDVYIGYGKGYENTRMPDCSCGFRKRSDIDADKKLSEEIREIAKRDKKYFMTPTPKRFPRYEEGRIHFPRLEKRR